MPEPPAHHLIPFPEQPNSTLQAIAAIGRENAIAKVSSTPAKGWFAHGTNENRIAVKISATSVTLCLKIFWLSVGHSLREELSPDIRHGLKDFPFPLAQQISLPANHGPIYEQKHD